jgi:four helix bundle protein
MFFSAGYFCQMQKIKTFEDLIIWQKGIELSKNIYLITKEFPAEERYGLANQIRRAVVSVPSNIAEGYGRRTSNDYRQFLHISLGSLYEVQTQLKIGYELNIISLENFSQANNLAKEIDHMIYAITKKL